MPDKYEPAGWAMTRCTRCTVAWVRTHLIGQGKHLSIVCKLDMARVPPTLTSCDNFEDRAELTKQR